MQLRPIFGKFIYEKPANKKFQPLHQVEPLWKNCDTIVLEINFRQGEGNYSEILNRARTGDLTDVDKEILETRRLHPKRDKHKIHRQFFYVEIYNKYF